MLKRVVKGEKIEEKKKRKKDEGEEKKDRIGTDGFIAERK